MAEGTEILRLGPPEGTNIVPQGSPLALGDSRACGPREFLFVSVSW